jgi:predicted DsbA family dithiol-disulfide isomerase
MVLTDKISVDIISDVMCPWCLVGYKRFEQALKQLGVEDKFKITWHPFELNPNIAIEGEELLEHLSNKYSMSTEQAKEALNKMKDAFDDAGSSYVYEEGKRILKTVDAHILLDYAQDSGKQTELKLALFEAYFTENRDISKREVLEDIVKSVGLDSTKAMARLDESNSIEDIKEKENYWLQRGIKSVPTIVFNQSSMMNGAYPVESYKGMIKKLLETKNTKL